MTPTRRPSTASSNSEGQNVAHFNLTDLREADIELRGSTLTLGTMDGTKNVGRTTTVWWRRAGGTPVADLDHEEAALVADENPHILIGALDAVCRRWVDHPDVIARAERKLFQLDTARRLGVAVPRTLMTNDPDAANDWAASCPLIVKPLSPGFGLAPPTSVVSEQDLGLLTSNPSLLQERVDATADIQLVVIGGHVTAWSRPRSHDVVDWRTVDPNGNDFSLIESRFIRDPAIALNASLGLTMAVQDWLMTTDGSVFLEANPQGA